MSADDYFTKMKGFASELAAVGKPLDDDELVGYLLRGLDKDHYNSLITNINGKPDTTLDEFFGQLSSYDMRNGPGHGAHEGFTSSANIARRGQENDRDRPRARSPDRRDRGRQDYRGGGGGGFRRDRRDDTRGDRDDRPRRRTDDRRQDSGKGRRRTDRAPTPFVDTTCQICNIYGHPAKDCWWRYGDDDDSDDRGSKGDKSANHASYGIDTNWYSDTGATDHITSELNKLLMANKYNGQDRIRTAKGTGMSISHIGNSILRIPHGSFDLNNILHVPNASKIILSHKFTLDNHVFIKFHHFFF
jgi:hypothetical protein